MAGVRIIRAALRDLQKLSHDDFGKVQIVLKRLSQDDLRDTKSLEGFAGLLRTRSGNLRVVWKRDKQDIIIIKVGDRRDIYRESWQNRKVYNPPHLNLVSQTLESANYDAINVANTPQYQWDFQGEEYWYQFVYGGYRYSPILTSEQEKIYDYLLNNLTNYQNHYGTLLVQSAPGTGKTVCAALLASRLHRQGCEIIFIVPDKLVEDIKKYPEVKLQIKKSGFWIGTFSNWLKRNLRNDKLASPEQELLSLQNAARRIPNNYKQRLGKVQMQDVLLYQAFVLDNYPIKESREAFFQANRERIELLKHIKYDWWETALEGYLCRITAANTLQSQFPSPASNYQETIIIVDEAQDLLLAEITTLLQLGKSWRELGHATTSLILGDLNQRIQPTGFHWDKLKLGKEICLKYNYRNSQKILEFANQFLEIAKTYGGRKLPTPGESESGVEVGESVRLLECTCDAEAWDFLRQLMRQTTQPENQRYLLRNLANAVKVISPHSGVESENLIMLNAEAAKGREFDACIAFSLFAGTSQPSLGESFQWYTMLTRARSRLLIVATSAELERVGRKYFQSCLPIEPEAAISWITEIASDVEVNQIPNDIQKILLKRCEIGYVYWDTYSALELAGVTENKLYQWEQKAIAHLQSHCVNHLESELAVIPYVPLRCLLLRAMDHSWKAVSMAQQIKDTDPQQYSRIINSIARDLEGKNLPYEAARVRYHINQTFPEKYPFPEIIDRSGNLVSLLSQLIVSRSFEDI
jgi:mRNA-degrading endonuclease RelE of RelBE toxin-antitoxin system